MGRNQSDIQPHPVGTQLVRLRDVPLEERMHAARVASAEAKDIREAIRLLQIARDPGNAGGRIAA